MARLRDADRGNLIHMNIADCEDSFIDDLLYDRDPIYELATNDLDYWKDLIRRKKIKSFGILKRA